jgi:1-acyl-sn-glycerol-3-phosphate acyltransferase
MKRFRKALITARAVSSFLLESFLVELLWKTLGAPEYVRAQDRSARMGRYARWLLPNLGFQITLRGSPPIRTSLIVSNHLSFWDIVILSAHTDAAYITSVETRETPFLGQMCKAAGSVFVERRSRLNKSAEVASVVERLQDDVHVVLYAEATSGSGEGVLPFKKTFFQAAVDAQVPVFPVVVAYLSLDQDQSLTTLQDRVFYYGKQPFARQLWKILAAEKVEAVLEFGAPIQPASLDRDVLCQESYDWIQKAYRRYRNDGEDPVPGDFRGSYLASIPPSPELRDPGGSLRSDSPASA